MTDDDLIKGVTHWIIDAKKGQLPYEFYAKAIIKLVRADERERILKEIETKVMTKDDVIEAIKNPGNGGARNE